ncbi:MAG: NnrS family protein [Pseudomonadales bacterium]|nr:NnrS family protein [Pseudomonadales bacterium]
MLLALGFRPFYLAAPLFAAGALSAWLLVYHGVWQPHMPLPPVAWHAHEMLFGFAAAVIAGFLLTAARNWTGRETASGALLLALVLLWLTARVLNLVGPGPLGALVDAAFLPVCALVLAIPLWRARNRRNYFVVPLLIALGLVNLLHHGAYLAGWSGSGGNALPTVAVNVAAGLIALLMTVIGGRVIPAFSANAIPGLRPRVRPWVEYSVVGLMLLLPVLDLAGGWLFLPGGTLVALLVLAASLQLVRLAGWQPWRTRGNALLAMLPLAYAWIPLYLLLRAAALENPAMASVALHALVVGAMASLMLAMMTRSALGHTGRALRAGSVELACFAAIQAAALVRVGGPLLVPGAHALWITLSGVLAVVAFAIFAAGYWPILTRPRIDGRPG